MYPTCVALGLRQSTESKVSKSVAFFASAKGGGKGPQFDKTKRYRDPFGKLPRLPNSPTVKSDVNWTDSSGDCGVVNTWHDNTFLYISNRI